jgi:hypothetical protein
MGRVKLPVILSVLAVLAAPPAGAEGAILSLGARAGIADYSGDVLYRSGDVGQDLVLGAHAQIGLLPNLAVEGAAEYFATTFRYATTFLSTPLSREVDFRDVAFYATVKLSAGALPVLPLHVYIGGGPDVHLLNTDVVRQQFTAPEEPPETALSNASRGGFHVVAGLDAAGFLLPLGAFAEARYSRFGSNPTLTAKSAVVGFRVGL